IGLEFELRMQEYIELIRSNRKSDAISYCRKHMKPWKDRHLKEISRASTLLVFSPDTQCSPYKKLFSPSRWEELAAYFRSAVYRLYGLPSQPHLHLLLQTGLTALKCTDCYSDDPAFRNRDCPVCQRDAMGFLAEDLPLNQHANSLLVCGISGQKMDEDNPPMRLPNGNVYSYNALKEIMAANNAIVCPRTGEKYALADCQRLFIC
ncbi:GID complex subunit containing RING finger motif, partial [Spiromyces aspiralis]